MKFDYNGSVALFEQVAEQLEQEIFVGLYREGDQVPSTTEISKTYQLNPATVLKGMNLLVDQGILEKRRGLGTFVKLGGKKIIQKKQVDRFQKHTLPAVIREAQNLGMTESELLDWLRKGYRNDFND